MRAVDPAPICRIALLWRGDPTAAPPIPSATRLRLIFSALASLGAAAEPVVYSDEVAEAVRERLLGFDGVLVWVDPISEGKDRSRLDPMLRDVAARGVWVSAHPDVILKMGVKEVLHRTRDLGWGADTHLYRSADEFLSQFPPRLAGSGPRVLKQNRGNGGLGVWKVELAGAAASPDAVVRVLHARRGSTPEQLSLGAFMARCEGYFAADGRIIDQAFQPRLPEGMIRCYMAQGEAAGFGHQLVTALIAPPPASEGPEAALPGPRIMHSPDAAPFQVLRAKMESEWVPAMQRLLDIDTASLPALWDADFLYGPRTRDGRDTHVLCEINVSAVAPYPDSAAPKAAEAALRCVLAARKGR
ncbi:MAG: Cj0069 family protein [Caulobacteraceae bacterium]